MSPSTSVLSVPSVNRTTFVLPLKPATSASLATTPICVKSVPSVSTATPEPPLLIVNAVPLISTAIALWLPNAIEPSSALIPAIAWSLMSKLNAPSSSAIEYSLSKTLKSPDASASIATLSTLIDAAPVTSLIVLNAPASSTSTINPSASASVTSANAPLMLTGAFAMTLAPATPVTAADSPARPSTTTTLPSSSIVNVISSSEANVISTSLTFSAEIPENVTLPSAKSSMPVTSSSPITNVNALSPSVVKTCSPIVNSPTPLAPIAAALPHASTTEPALTSSILLMPSSAP